MRCWSSCFREAAARHAIEDLVAPILGASIVALFGRERGASMTGALILGIAAGVIVGLTICAMKATIHTIKIKRYGERQNRQAMRHAKATCRFLLQPVASLGLDKDWGRKQFTQTVRQMEQGLDDLYARFPIPPPRLPMPEYDKRLGARQVEQIRCFAEKELLELERLGAWWMNPYFVWHQQQERRAQEDAWQASLGA